MKKSKIILFGLICFIIGIISCYIFFNNQKLVSNNKENQNTTPKINYDKSIVNTNLIENLKSQGINPKTLDNLKILFILGNEERKIYQYNDQIFKYGTFKDNNKTIYIDYKDLLLTNNKPTNTNYTEENTIILYSLNDYYLLLKYDINDGGHFKIFDKNLNELFADMFEQQIAITDNSLYYTTFECTNNKKEVHKLNLTTMHSSFDFYLDHLAGWKC